MALRAGVPVADVEFFQFHPTALHHPAMPRPLLSEALRGHGALLRDAEGERFVDELAAARRGQPGHGGPDGRAGRGLPVARRHRARVLRRAVPDGGGVAARRGARSRRGLAARSRRRPTTCRAGVVTDLDGASALPGLVGGGRGGLHRCARGQPAGLELAARGDGVRGPAGRVHRGGTRRPRGHRRDGRVVGGTGRGRRGTSPASTSTADITTDTDIGRDTARSRTPVHTR